MNITITISTEHYYFPYVLDGGNLRVVKRTKTETVRSRVTI